MSLEDWQPQFSFHSRFSLAGRLEEKGAGKGDDGDAGKEDDGCDD